MKTNNQAVRKFRFGVTLGLGACLVAVAQACPKLGDQFVAATVDSNADGVPDVIVKGRVIPIVVDVDDMSMIVIQPSTSPFLVESSGGTYGA